MKFTIAIGFLLLIASQLSAQVIYRSEPVENEAYDLCEGPHYDEKLGLLLHVDINGHKVCKLNVTSHVSECIELTDLLTLVHPYAEGGDNFLVTQRNKIVHLNWKTKANEVIAEVAKDQGGKERFNDGKPDAKGVLWLGTILEGNGGVVPGKGNLYRYDGATKTFVKQADNFTLTNGMTWSNDNKKMFVNDSEGRKIYKFDFDLERGTLSNKIVLVDCVNNADFKDGEYPDGLTIDSNGHLWSALYGGGRVVRVNPDTGRVEESVAVGGGPLTTSVAFGGANLDELFVTVAYKNYGPDQRINYPNAGRVHRITAEGSPSTLKGAHHMYTYKPSP